MSYIIKRTLFLLQGKDIQNQRVNSKMHASHILLFSAVCGWKNFWAKISLRKTILPFDLVSKSTTIKTSSFQIEQSEEYKDMVISKSLFEEERTSKIGGCYCIHCFHPHDDAYVVSLYRIIKGEWLNLISISVWYVLYDHIFCINAYFSL